jgi:hypothetical protein
MMSKGNKIVQSGNELLIAGLSSKSRWFFLLYWILLGTALVFLTTTFDFSTILVFFIPAHFFINWSRLRFPANFRPLTLRKDNEFVYVNNKALPLEELLFLSFHETEAYAIIRLEARRENILFPKEVKLMSDCSGFEEALQVCRDIRDFVDPDLKINHVMLVSGKSENTGRWGSRRIKFEHWEFIQ